MYTVCCYVTDNTVVNYTKPTFNMYILLRIIKQNKKPMVLDAMLDKMTDNYHVKLDNIEI